MDTIVSHQDKTFEQIISLVPTIVQNIKNEQEVLDMLFTLKTRSKEIVESKQSELQALIAEVFKRKVAHNSALDIFLNKKPPIPHEYYANYREAVSGVLAKIMCSDFGESVAGGVEDFSFGYNEGRSLWDTIHGEFEKILNDHLSTTPFLDDQRSSSWVRIGFRLNSRNSPGSNV